MTIYTIGHSNHPWERFLALLSAAKIRTLIDVRSYPRSRWPQYNRDVLKTGLDAVGIEYRFFGAALGGRGPSQDVRYQDIAETAEFGKAMTTVIAIAEQSRAVLMCSEHEPLQCHRCLLLGRNLAERNHNIIHILRDGQMERHTETEKRLLQKFADRDLLPTEYLGSAYLLQEHAIRKA
jgi:uncharacterized protein (DUF488 family)